MRPIEADWIREYLLALGPEQASPLANLGSSTGHFRAVKKPHIEERLFRPLREAGFEIVHVDLKEAEGVDIAGDLNDPTLVERLRSQGFRSIVCSNLLEHVPRPEAIAQACEQIVAPGGHIVVTVPKSYPWHPDPIDTMYRPSPDELAVLFPGSSLTSAEMLMDSSLLRDEADKGLARLAIFPLRMGWHLLNARRRPVVAKAARARIAALLRPIEVTVAAFRRKAQVQVMENRAVNC